MSVIYFSHKMAKNGVGRHVYDVALTTDGNVIHISQFVGNENEAFSARRS